MSPAADPRTAPTGIELVGDREMEIAWQDGHRSRYSAEQLRAECPCATCRREKTGLGDVAITIGAPLPLLPRRARRGAGIRSVDPVGYYAIRIGFTDGHDTGLFSFDFLRALDDPPGAPTRKP